VEKEKDQNNKKDGEQQNNVAKEYFKKDPRGKTGGSTKVTRRQMHRSTMIHQS